jgi:hypothetical protein
MSCRPEAGLAAVRALAATADDWSAGRWSDAEGVIDAVATRIGQARAAVRTGIEAHLGALDEAGLSAWLERSGPPEGPPGDGGAPLRVAILAADNLPGVGLFPAVAGLLAGARVTVKLPADGEPFLEAFVAELRRRDEGVGSRLQLAAWRGGSTGGDRVIDEADLLVVLGRDETVARLSARRPGRVIGLGTGLSFALVEEGAPLRDAARLLARDVALWEQAGCLSPRGVLFEGGTAKLREFLDHLAEAMEDRARAWAPRPRTVAEEAAARILRAELEARARSGEVGDVRLPVDGSSAWTVWVEAERELSADGARGAAERDAGWPDRIPNPLLRSLWIRRVAGREAVLDFFRAAPRERLQALAVALRPDEPEDPFLSSLRACGVHHVAPVGELQSPPVDWPNKGRDLLRDFSARTPRPGA